MAVTFVIGRAGSGKTARIFGRVADAARAEPLGPPVVWLLPKQATFMAERELTCTVGAFSRVRVVSFEALGRMIEADCGGSAVPEVTDLGRLMVLGHLLRRHQGQLGFFASVARRPGLAAELDATFAEFERSGKTTADLADLLDQLKHADPADAQGPSLQAKLRDLLLLYDAYTRYLGQERFDQHRRLTQVREKLEQCPLLRPAVVYVDGFADFTDYERRILVGLAKTCRSVEIALLIDPSSPTVRDPHHLPDELSLFHRTETTYRKLWFAMTEEGVDIAEPVKLSGAPRFRGLSLNSIEAFLFRTLTPSPGTPGDASGSSDCPRAGRGEGPGDRGLRIADCGFGQAPSGTPVPNPKSKVQNPKPEEDPHPNPLPEYRAREQAGPLSVPAAVSLLEAPDLPTEVAAVALEIKSLLQQGYRLRDIVVLVRDLEPYHRLIDTTFREHGLPYFVDRRRTATHHPLLQFVRSLFQIARGGWPHHAVITLLKSGLAGVTLPEADDIENYLLQHRLRGRAWDDPEEWRFQRRSSAEGDDAAATSPELFETRTIDSLRRQIVERLRPLLDRVRAASSSSSPVTVRDLAAEVFHTFERFGVRATVSRWLDEAAAAGDLELRGEHEQVWAELAGLFEQMVDLLGDEPVSAADFVDVLESGLERFDLALTPPTVDQVLVGQVDRTRTPAVRAAFVLGLNEGSFPHVPRDVTILSHVERRELRRRRIDLDPDPHQRQLDERLLGYIAFTRPSERLIVTRPLADESGRPAEPSGFWAELRRILPDVEPISLPRETGRDVRQIATPRQLVTCLMRWAGEERQGDNETWRQGDGEVESASSVTLSPCHLVTQSSSDPRPAFYQWLATHPGRGDAVGLLRDRAWGALGYRNLPALSPEVARRLFPSPLRVTAAQLETQAACPFRHFMRYGMRLAGREAHDVTALDMSHVFHEVLEILVAELMEGGRDWTDLPADEAERLVHAYAGAVAQQLRGEVMLGTARNKYLLQRIERTLGQVIASLREMLARGRFRPAHAGVRFDDTAGAGLPAYPLRTPGGAEVRVGGRIDRIDIAAEDGALAVFDYKLSGDQLSVGNLYHGLSLQLLTYLLVLEASGQQLTGKPLTPAAAFYLQLLRGLQNVDHPDDALDPSDPLFHLRHKPRGVFDARFLKALDSQVEPGESSKVVSAYLKEDGQFGFRDRSDAADAQEFSTLLGFVRTRLGQIADEVIAGRVDVAPYRVGRTTPCPRCEYRPVCRFEPAVDGYRHLTPLRRSDALDRMTGRATGGEDRAG